jgi:hypothetical protein
MYWLAESTSTNEQCRWSLGRAINTSPHFSLRILAANLVREISLADIDICLFWPSDLLEVNEARLPSSFLADQKWLQDTILHLRCIDERRKTERYAFLVHGSKPLICEAEKSLTKSCL